MLTLLETFKGSQIHGVKDLADAAERLLRSIGPSQGKGTVTEYPNERTIRYYLTEGLLPEPIDKRGLTSVFGYEHLLALLAIKKLQAGGLPISVIKTLIGGKSANELESLLYEEADENANRSPVDVHRESTDGIDDLDISFSLANVNEDLSDPEVKPNKAKEYLESLLLNRADGRDDDAGPLFSMAAKRPAASGPEPSASRSAESWRRYTIAQGVEVHIEKNYKPPRKEHERTRILEFIERILRFRSHK